VNYILHISFLLDVVFKVFYYFIFLGDRRFKVLHLLFERAYLSLLGLDLDKELFVLLNHLLIKGLAMVHLLKLVYHALELADLLAGQGELVGEVALSLRNVVVIHESQLIEAVCDLGVH